MADKKKVGVIDFNNLQKENAMEGASLHVGETIYDKDGKEILHLCKRISPST